MPVGGIVGSGLVGVRVAVAVTVDAVVGCAVGAGVSLPQEFILRLIGDLSGMGPLLELIARSDVEDIAINLGHLYAYTTERGWEHVGPAPDGIGEGLRVMLDQAGQSNRTDTNSFSWDVFNEYMRSYVLKDNPKLGKALVGAWFETIALMEKTDAAGSRYSADKSRRDRIQFEQVTCGSCCGLQTRCV